MRGSKAKRLRKEAYGDLSIRQGDYKAGGVQWIKNVTRFFAGKGKPDDEYVNKVRVIRAPTRKASVPKRDESGVKAKDEDGNVIMESVDVYAGGIETDDVRQKYQRSKKRG